MKRFLMLSMIIMLCAVVLPVTANAVSSGTCGDNVTWTLSDDGTLTISGAGAMAQNRTYAKWGADVKTVIIEKGVTTIGSHAFKDCVNLVDVTISEGVTYIAIGAFENCVSLNTIDLPDSLIVINSGVFRGCSGLTSLHIPANVSGINTLAFSGSNNLRELSVSPENKTYAALDGVLIDKKKQTLLCCPPGRSGEYFIPNGITGIGSFAFYGCADITSIDIPSSVVSISYNVFVGCSSLRQIDVAPDNSAYASADGILYDKSMQSLIRCPSGKAGEVIIPDGVTTIGLGAFGACSNMTSVSMPDSVSFISDSAFSDCSSLTSVTIPKGVTAMDSNVFEGCANLTSISILGTRCSLYVDDFDDCPNLMSITVSPEHQFYSSVNGILLNKAGTNIIYYPPGLAKDFYIPEGVNSIGYCAFHGCADLVSIEIPDGVTSIGERAFFECPNLVSVTIPDSVTSIGEGAFEYCQSLSAVSLLDGIRTIENGAFFACSGLSFISIPGSVQSIGDSAFALCSSLESITLPYGLQSIGSNAFESCSSLMSINIPDSVTSIDGYAFYDCTSLTSIIIPDSVTEMGECIFYGCSNLSSIVLPNSLLYLGNILGDRTFLTSVTIPYGVQDIFGFSNCINLTSVIIPGSASTIQPNAFSGCSNLTQVFMGDGLALIGMSAFSDCSSLSSINLPASVTYIDDNAFSGCDALTDVYYAGTENDRANIRIGYNNNDCLENATWHYGSAVSTGFCGADDASNMVWTLDANGQLTIDGLGKMQNYSSQITPPWGKDVVSVIVKGGVARIGDYAFSECDRLEEIHIATAFTRFGSLVCNGAPTVYCRPESYASRWAKEKGYAVVYEGVTVTTITLPSSITNIEYEAFVSTSADIYELPASVTYIGSRAFAGLNGSLLVGPRAFAGLDDSTLVIIPVTGSIDIAEDAFLGSTVVIECPANSPVEAWAAARGIPTVNP